MEFIAEETANRFLNVSDEEVTPNEDVKNFLTNRGQFTYKDSNPYIYITTTDGTILSSNKPRSPMQYQLHPSILASDKDVLQLKIENSEELNGNYYVIKKPIEYESYLLGWVAVFETEENLTKVNQEYRQLFIMIISLAILGWAAIYFVSKKLSKPIKEVARASRQVQAGDYNIQLSDNGKIEEVHDLVYSFKGMSNQLQQLENLRTELLAGVTHELKTPVTSISGLLQAVNDGIVSGDEAKEFLQISLKETTKMRKMVEDLLAFNAFAANAVPLSTNVYSINKLIKDFIHQWEITSQDQSVIIHTTYLTAEQYVKVDSIRLQQIITNLLNNAQQAVEENGTIEVVIGKDVNNVTIDIKDNGIGIPKEEQSFIFERFYRGERKKYKVGGLGLGLPFSKMIAQSMNGNLELLDSSPSGTTFRITLPIVRGN